MSYSGTANREILCDPPKICENFEKAFLGPDRNSDSLEVGRFEPSWERDETRTESICAPLLFAIGLL